jgi:uncharacterized protein YxjI
MGAAFCPYCGAAFATNSSFGTMSTPAYQGAPSLSRLVPQFSGNAYIIEQKILALRDTFGIKDRNGTLLAYVKKQLVSFGPKFWYEGTNQERLGEIHGKVLAIRPTFEIYDAQSQMVAQVKKKILTVFGEQWWMENSSGQEIAKVKGNIFEHDYHIQDMSGQPIAQIHKKWVSIRDSYGVEIFNQNFDPYLVLSYCISLDNTEKKEKH